MNNYYVLTTGLSYVIFILLYYGLKVKDELITKNILEGLIYVENKKRAIFY